MRTKLLKWFSFSPHSHKRSNFLNYERKVAVKLWKREREVSIRLRTGVRACNPWEMGFCNSPIIEKDIGTFVENVFLKRPFGILMKIMTLESSKTPKWVLIQSSFFSIGLFFTITMLFDLKSSKQDFVYALTECTSILYHGSWKPFIGWQMLLIVWKPYARDPISFLITYVFLPLRKESASRYSSVVDIRT